MTETTFRIPKRAVTLFSSATLALAGTATLASGWFAEATPGDPHKVWVCKYVQTPHSNEVLKAGKNPIFVDWASLTLREDAPEVGDTFSDAHERSVVVQIGGASPGTGACVVTPPTTTTPPTTPPTTTTSMPPTTTTTKPPTTTTRVPTPQKGTRTDHVGAAHPDAG